MGPDFYPSSGLNRAAWLCVLLQRRRPATGEAGGCCRAPAAGGSRGSSAFRPHVPKVCCVPTVCLGKTNEKHNLKVI